MASRAGRLWTATISWRSARAARSSSAAGRPSSAVTAARALRKRLPPAISATTRPGSRSAPPAAPSADGSPTADNLGSAVELDAVEEGEQRAEPGQAAPDRQPLLGGGPGVEEGAEARHGHHDQLGEQRGDPGRGLVADVRLAEVPQAGQDEDGEGRPGDPVEAAGDGPRGVGAEGPQPVDEPGQRQLAADPDGGGEDVEEQPDRGRVDGEHPASLPERA